MTAKATTLIQDQIRRWRADPLRWVREDLGAEPDLWQIDVLNAYGNEDEAQLRIAMMACVGPGKSAVLAWCGLHFLLWMGHEHVHPQATAVSITEKNLRAGLWKELGVWMGRSEIAKQVLVKNSDRIYNRDHPDTWFLDARTYPKSASPEEIGATLSGIHGKYLLYLIDEMGSMAVEVGRAAEQGFAEKDPIFHRILGAGNPISRKGLLYDMGVRRRAQHIVVHITGDPDDPKRSNRIPIEWAREQIEAYGGRDHPWVMAHILGQFPPAEFNALLTEEQVRTAMRRAPHPSTYRHSSMVLGVDVAGDGGDRSVIFPRQGWMAYPPVVMRSSDSIQGSGHIARLTRELDVTTTFLDGSGGFALGWRDQCRVLGIEPRSVQFAGRAEDHVSYANKRAEMWWRMRQWVLEGGALPDAPELIDELTVPTYNYKGDRLIIEPKEDIKEQISRSPDLADALALTFAEFVPPKKFSQEAQRIQAAPDIQVDPFEGM